MALYQQIFFTTLAVAFGILHFILYLYNSRLKSNLYFAVFLFMYALNIFFDFQAGLTLEAGRELFYLRIHRAVMPYAPIFVLLFLYSIFEIKIAAPFWMIAAGLMITGFFAILDPVKNFNYVQIFLVAVGVEGIRIFNAAVRRKQKGAWIIGAGFLLLFLFSCYDMLLDLRLFQPINGIVNGYPFGFVFLIISSSIFLARDFANLNEKMLAQERKTRELEISQRLLQAEDARKSKELDEARRLQLAMLPKCIHDFPGFDICFYMQAATEVGGDYYDYQLAADGTLIIAIGDATGHGMKAGIMVSIIKSLFLTQAGDADLPAFFEKGAQTIKQMRLGNLYMALALVKIKGRKMVAASAGMPPIYLYRSATKAIEAMVIKGMPLGGPASQSYRTVENMLYPGDAVLLMSDGLPELFNDQNEMLDYPRIEAIFQEAAEESSTAIVRRLLGAGKDWSKERPQADDITCVVIKVKADENLMRFEYEPTRSTSASSRDPA